MIELVTLNKNVIEWSYLSKIVFDTYIDRFKRKHLPQKPNSSRITKVENIYFQFIGTIDYNKAIELIGLEAFGDVTPRFQKNGTDKLIIGENFITLILKRSNISMTLFFKIVETDKLNIISEIDARWSLLEGTFKINKGDWSLSNNLSEIFKASGYDRKPLSNNIPFLMGYQGSVCFYRCEHIGDTDIHVYHFKASKKERLKTTLKYYDDVKIVLNNR